MHYLSYLIFDLKDDKNPKHLLLSLVNAQQGYELVKWDKKSLSEMHVFILVQSYEKESFQRTECSCVKKN